MRKKFIAGNWKMYKTPEEAKAFAEEMKAAFKDAKSIEGRPVLDEKLILGIMAPYTSLETLTEAFKGTEIKVGAQNMYYEREGAYTGEISPLMLKAIGVTYCVIGHSERRQYFCETNELLNMKLKAALENDILPIFCVGERLEDREGGKAFSLVEEQVREGLQGILEADVLKITIAYEPVWAIGTGKTASSEEANEMCAFIRSLITKLYGQKIAERILIQYGGSVKGENAKELLNMPDIDGALVGGASLKLSSFMEIVNYNQL